VIGRVLLSAALAVGVGGAQAFAQIAPAPSGAGDVIAHMLARNASLTSYQARVHVNLHMLNFPFLAPSLDGTSYYKRPDNYEVVFDRVPSYAKGFEKLFNDVDDPARWQQDQNVELQGEQSLDGRRVLVLKLTKKIHSDILDHTLVFVDPSNYELIKMEWHYVKGGMIAMTQQYRTEGDYSFVASQHVTIDRPDIHVHAVGDSQFANYQTNVAVNDSVFTKQP
jgi:outer membrane lipoprotein-sorting protein